MKKYEVNLEKMQVIDVAENRVVLTLQDNRKEAAVTDFSHMPERGHAITLEIDPELLGHLITLAKHRQDGLSSVSQKPESTYDPEDEYYEIRGIK